MREPRNPDFKQIVTDSFHRQGLMSHLGAQLANIDAGLCEIRVPFRPEVSQQHGYFHAGVTGSIADTSCGYAAFSLAPPGFTVLTVEYKLNLTHPALGQTLISRAKVVKSGKTLLVCQADVSVEKDGEEKPCAIALATIMIMPSTPDRTS